MTAVLIAEQDASREVYKYNIEKTKTIVVNTKSSPDFSLNNKSLRVSNKESHLSTCRTHNSINVDTIDARIKNARKATYSLMGASLNGLDVVGPDNTTHTSLPPCCMGRRHW